MKKVLSFALALFILFTMTVIFSVTSSAISGQTSEETKEIFQGVTSTHYTLGSGTTYGLQDMTLVKFDPKQTGLSVNVTTGYSALNSLSTVSNTNSRWNAANPDKIPLAAINGDWFTVSYDNYSSATSKKQLYLPLGFNMHGGEIVCTQQTSLESPSAAELGDAPSFGIAADGTPLIGCIRTTVTLQIATGRPITLDGINRLPSDNAIVMYTDRGPSSNYCLDDALEVYIDFDDDVVVKDGCVLSGTITGISQPGEARQAIKANRIILTARGTRVSALSRAAVDKAVKIKVSITDAYGNTEQWKTVTDCVGGHHMFAYNGTYFNIGDSTKYPASIIGITAEGKVIFLCNDGRQSGYSLGVAINKMADLARELGIVSGIYMDGGGSTTMVQRTASGGYTLVNRPCNTNNAERSVGNAVILALDVPQGETYTFDDSRYISMVGTLNNTTATITDDGLKIMTTTAYDPFTCLTNFNLSASDYKYIVLDMSTTYKKSGNQTVGAYLYAGSTAGPTESCKAILYLPQTKKREKLLLDASSLSLWKGKINGIRIDTFDNFTGNESGLGVVLHEMKFFKTLKEANDYINPFIRGDINGDGFVTSKDVAKIKLLLAGSAVGPIDRYDVNGDGYLTSGDLASLKLLLAS